MADLKVEQKQTLSREDAARLIAALADGLGDDGKVTVQLGSSTLELSVASQLDCELEVSVDGDEIELELELTWLMSGRASAGAAEDEAEEDEAEADEAEQDEAEADEAEADEAEADEAEEGKAEEGKAEAGKAEAGEAEEGKAEQVGLGVEPEDHDLDEDPSGSDVSAAGEAQSDGADAEAAGSVEVKSARAVPADRTPRPRGGRRSASADTGQSSNGVDTAAVRRWAAANGLAVSPRGPIKGEVLQAYRDAGN